MSATDTSLKPACLMMPSSSRALTAANCASPGGDLLVYAMQLPKPYLLDAKLAAAPDRLLTQIFWIAVRLPHARAWTPESCLGRDQNAVIGIERPADQLFRHIRAVGVGAAG